MIESQVLAQALRYIAKYGGAKVQPVEYLEMDYDTFYSYDYYGGGESDYADHLVDPPNGDNTEAVVKGQGKYQSRSKNIAHRCTTRPNFLSLAQYVLGYQNPFFDKN